MRRRPSTPRGRGALRARRAAGHGSGRQPAAAAAAAAVGLEVPPRPLLWAGPGSPRRPERAPRRGGRRSGGRARRAPVSRRAACTARRGPARRSTAAPARVSPAAEGLRRRHPAPSSRAAFRRSWQRARTPPPCSARLGSPCLAPPGVASAEGRGGGPGPRPEVRGAAGLAVPRRTPALKAGPKRGGKSCFVVGAFSGFGGFSWGFLAVRKPALAGQALWGNAPLLPYLFRLVPTLSGRAPSETPRPPHTLPSPAWAPVQASSVSVCPADSPPQRRLLSRRKCYL